LNGSDVSLVSIAARISVGVSLANRRKNGQKFAAY